MIIQINEHFHDYEEEIYWVDSEKLKAEGKKYKNPINDMVLKEANKKAFNQEVYIMVPEWQEKDPENDFWEEPGLHCAEARIQLKDGDRPDKIVKLIINFDC